MTKTYEWRERSAKWYYYDTTTGLIVGTTNKYALQDVWTAFVYTGTYSFSPRPDDEKPLGQYIEQEYAKRAVEYFWEVQSRTLLEHHDT